MTTLWLAAVALLVLALLFVVPPLLRSPGARSSPRAELLRRLHADRLAGIEKDIRSGALGTQDRAQAIDELQRQVLEETSQATPRAGLPARPWMAWGVAGVLSIGLPAAALLLYLQVGNPMAAATQMLAAERSGSHEGDGADVERMVGGLAARLRSQPDDLEGWIVLARSYEYLKRYDDAVVAYQKAMALAPDQPLLLADYADALASARDGDLEGPARAALDAALAIDPDHPKSLALSGMAAFKRGDLPLARQRWERVLALLPPDSEAAQRIGADLARLDTAQPPAAPPAAPRVAAARRHVAGTVSIAAALRDAVAPQDTVFVLARAAATGRMPVAVLRLQARDLPAAFVLDDSLAMSPDATISRFEVLTIEVRVSRSGQAAPQPGDLSGSVADVALGQEGVALQADKVSR
ncbi:c-type cytochrome biogenesis protein CcmI [Variovorax saccharolyticus]|uniref:c-type cytochrome biogenesis protein CcmI n=1 Tax=Variovorax saccharolyticus TaxID=3053516 RepID=UPI0025775CE3|nr:c-type cytochrome biogenesis protein CcmI [Variovorax sp. J22R187]MDM0018123.1 c-type cytochrome biogenesis protein CcmI [Variovorax sp. J22R187]